MVTTGREVLRGPLDPLLDLLLGLTGPLDWAAPHRFRKSDAVSAKNRVHLDLRAAPGLEGDERMAALEAESDRLVGLGATRVERNEGAPPMSAGHIVMADPEGNEFFLD